MILLRFIHEFQQQRYRELKFILVTLNSLISELKESQHIFNSIPESIINIILLNAILSRKLLIISTRVISQQWSHVLPYYCRISKITYTF